MISLACSSGDSAGTAAPPSSDDPLAPAGTVVEVTGQVTARSVGETSDRALANQAVVLAGDTITTGADGSVKIRLHHNQAILALAGGKTRLLRESLAWKAAKGGGDLLASATNDDTAVAGRHAEREAAGTAATALRETDDSAAPPAPVAKPVARPTRRRAKAKPKSPPPPPTSTATKGGGQKSSGGDLDDLLRQSVVPADNKQKTTMSKASAPASEGRPRKAIVAGMDSARPAFLRCAEKFPTKGVVRIKVTVAASGKVTSVAVAASPDPDLGNCVATAVRKVRFAPAAAESVFTYPVSLR